MSLKFKLQFFDSRAVISKVDRATRRVLSKFGAFVRRTAKGSIRKRKKSSEPGKPPSSHTGLLKKFIWFGYEPEHQTVVIGPAALDGHSRGTAPELAEHGGFGMVLKKGKPVRRRYRARPFMGPALDKEQPKLSAMWRDSVN